MGKKGMIDISEKQPTRRLAEAVAVIKSDAETVQALKDNTLPKADPLPTARAAALLALKRTAQLIPHCHPIPITDAEVEFEVRREEIVCCCRVATQARTGVEMEALCGAAMAALTLYDMIKGVCPGAEIRRTRLLEKSGGKHGHWRAEDTDD